MRALTYESIRRGTPPPTSIRHYALIAFAAVAVIAAYHVSLASLLDALRLDTPTAHIALVPPIAAGLAWLQRASGSRGAPVHDRQVDWIVGVPLLAIAAGVALWLPKQLSGDYWAERVDLLSLPFFAAGTVTVLFGVRTLWQYRVPLAYLVLAWPRPYNEALDRGLGRLTDLTVGALATVNDVVNLARRADDDGSLFNIVHGKNEITLSVASACSGANGVVGFFVVGTALVFAVEGRRRAKAFWLVCGAILVWIFNVVRILALFAAVRWWGESVAIDGLHPIAGLITFTVSMVAMLAVMPRFGLRLRALPKRGARIGGPAVVPRSGAASVLVVVALAAVLGTTNVSLSHAAKVVDSLGTPRLAPFDLTRVEPIGFELNQTQEINWARRFFGRQSTWRRYAYTQTGDRAPAIDRPIYLDVIDTPDASALRAYGVEDCYRFHNYKISSDRTVPVGYGIEAGVLSWSNERSDSTWTTVYWQWRVKHGDAVRFERMTLIMTSDASADDSDAAPVDDPGRARGESRALSASSAGARAKFAESERILADFARTIVELRVSG